MPSGNNAGEAPQHWGGERGRRGRALYFPALAASHTPTHPRGTTALGQGPHLHIKHTHTPDPSTLAPPGAWAAACSRAPAA